MAWFKNVKDSSIIDVSGLLETIARQNPQTWTEVADAQGTPLNTSPRWIPVTFQGATIAWQCSCGHACATQHCSNCDESATITPVPKQNVDTKEQELRSKILPAFRGEARCDFSKENQKLLFAPREPWFGAGNERSEQSKRKIKRWTATNLHNWPICRFSREPAQLEFHARDEFGGDGQYLIAKFTCGCTR